MFKLMVLGLALIGLIGCRDMLPEKETEKETTEIRDNHSYTEIVERLDNYTNITTTTTTEVTNTTNTSTSDSSRITVQQSSMRIATRQFKSNSAAGVRIVIRQFKYRSVVV